MNWALWIAGPRGPELTVLVDRGEDAPVMSAYERERGMGPPIKLAPAEQWLPIHKLERLYPAPPQDASGPDAPKTEAGAPAGAARTRRLE